MLRYYPLIDTLACNTLNYLSGFCFLDIDEDIANEVEIALHMNAERRCIALFDFIFSGPCAHTREWSTPQSGKETKTKTLRNARNFSYELSHRGVRPTSPRANNLKVTATTAGYITLLSRHMEINAGAPRTSLRVLSFRLNLFERVCRIPPEQGVREPHSSTAGRFRWRRAVPRVVRKSCLRDANGVQCSGWLHTDSA